MIKRMTLFLMVLIFTLFMTSNVISQIENSPYIPEGYELSFNDEFSEDIYLDTYGDGSENWAPWLVGWNVRYLSGNGDQCFKCDESYTGPGVEELGVVLHEVTEDSTLKLYGKQTPDDKLPIVENFPYIGGMISGQKNYWQQYGYFEVRCRFDISKGIHWAVWLLPIANKWPPEIDMLEVVGHQPKMVHMTAHWDDNGHKSNFQSFSPITTHKFHNYAFEWTPENMTWYIDGVKKKSMNNFIDEEMYFVISPEIASNWTGDPDETTEWPYACEVDYIRFYEMEDSPVVKNEKGNSDSQKLVLIKNYPNPFNPSTQIEYQLETNGQVKLDILNSSGKLIKTLVNENQSAGQHAMMWDATDENQRQVSNGVYISRLTIHENTEKKCVSRKMLLVK